VYCARHADFRLAAPGKMSRSTIIGVLKVVVTAILLYLFIRRTDFAGVVAGLSRLSFGLIAVLALLNLAGLFISAYKWHLLLPDASVKGLTMACFASYYIGLLLPGQFAQEAAKAYYLSLGRSPRMHRIAASVVVDKIISIIGLLVVGCIGLALSETRLPPSLAWLFVISGLLAITLLFSLRSSWLYSLAGRYLSGLGNWLPRQERIFSGGGRVIEAWHAYSKNLPLLTGNVLLAIIYQVVGVLMFYLLSRGLGLPPSFFDWAWIVGALTLALFLPVTIGGLGIREGTLIGILGMYGCDKEAAVAVSFVGFSFVLMLAIIGAILSFAIKGSGKETT
jgi:glycosyltransferase 2 family protein